MADTNARGSTAGATRNAAARSGIRNLRDMKSLPGSRLYIGLIPYRNPKTGQSPFQNRPLGVKPGQYPNLCKRTAYSDRGSIEHDMPKSGRPSLFGRAGTDRYLAPVCGNVKRHSSAASTQGNSRN